VCVCFHELLDAGFDGGRLASVFGAVPLTGTLGIVVLRRTEALALTEHTAAALVRFSRAYDTHQRSSANTESQLSKPVEESDLTDTDQGVDRPDSA